MPDGPSRFQEWLAELQRRKVFRVAVAYVVAGWVLIQVADATFEPLGLPPWSMKLVIALVALGFPLACVLAWAYDLTPQGIERTEAAAPEVAPPAPVDAPRVQPALAGPAVAPAPSARSVAILPFSDISPERDQAYFCDGIAEEIINALCCVRGLQIASRTSSFQFKDRSVDVREIGRTLGVGAVLEGSVRKAGDRVRITAQLVNTADGYHLWSESFDRRLEDVFAIQTEIARELVAALRGSLTSGEKELLERGGTRNPEAYDVYLRGQHLLRDGTDLTLPQAAELFRAAIERDGEFAQAYAGLANALAIKGLWRLDMTPEEFEQAFAASRRALELEPRMPEAYVAQACLLSMQNQVEPANEAFEEALKLNPSSFHANYMYGRHSFAAGEFEKACRLYEQAARLAPEQYLPYCMLEGALEKLGRRDQSREAGRRAMLAIERHLQREPGDGRALHLGAVTAAKLGDAARARALSERALTARPDEFATAYNLACAFAILGDRERALELLDRATQRGRGNLAWIEQDPDLDSLRGDPRFETIVDRLRAGTHGEG
jgi:TolB-like protein/Flp pilus assembly protein TadD